MMQGLPIGCSHVGHAPEASEILDRRSFSGGAILLVFSSTTMPFKSYLSCYGVKKMGLAPEGEAKR